MDIERKLKLLRDFSSGTTNLFVESLHKLEFAMQVVSILNQTRVNQDGTYSLPPGVDVTWFMTLKNEDEEIHRFISGVLGIEDITTLGLTQEQLDWYKRLRQSAGLNPSNLLKTLYDDAPILWAIVDKISQKYPKVADKFLDGLILLEKLGTSKAGKIIKKGIDLIDNFTSPLKGLFGDKVIKALSGLRFFNWIGKGANVVKFAGKAGTVFTFASIATEGLIEGISEGTKTKDFTKGFIAGNLAAVKSIGPLEGMTIGATFGSAIGGTLGTVTLPIVGTVAGGTAGGVIGGIVGTIAGGINWIAQQINPNLYDDIKNDLYKKHRTMKIAPQSPYVQTREV